MCVCLYICVCLWVSECVCVCVCVCVDQLSFLNWFMFSIPILFPAPRSDGSVSTDSSKVMPSLPAASFPAEAYVGVNPLKRESSSRNSLVTAHSISLDDVQATATAQKIVRKKGDTERVHYKVNSFVSLRINLRLCHLNNKSRRCWEKGWQWNQVNNQMRWTDELIELGASSSVPYQRRAETTMQHKERVRYFAITASGNGSSRKQ